MDKLKWIYKNPIIHRTINKKYGKIGLNTEIKIFACINFKNVNKFEYVDKFELLYGLKDSSCNIVGMKDVQYTLYILNNNKWDDNLCWSFDTMQHAMTFATKHYYKELEG